MEYENINFLMALAGSFFLTAFIFYYLGYFSGRREGFDSCLAGLGKKTITQEEKEAKEASKTTKGAVNVAV